MAKKIALLPLDSRPCNTKYPDYIAKIAGMDLVMPPKEYLGDLHKKADMSNVLKWLESKVVGVDLLILSFDMLVFGGLVPSRKNGSNNIDAAIKKIKNIKKKNPKLKIFAFSIITRLSITAEDEESAALWMNIFEFSKLIDSIDMRNDKNDLKKLSNLKKKIPRDVLDGYLQIRQRNHEANRRAIELASEKVFDYLVLGLEDAAEYGLHRKEKIALGKLIEEKGVKNKAEIINGADEIASLLVARAKAKSQDHSPRIAVRYLNADSKNIVSLYEDKPIKNVIFDHLVVAGGLESYSSKVYDLKLFINTPDHKQTDIFLAPPKPEKAVDPEIFLEINKEKAEGRLCSVADIKYCNGSDAGFMDEFLKKVDLSQVASFSAFNTTANSVGVSIAHAISYLLSEKKPEHLRFHKEFIRYSLISDFLYQSVVRREIIDRLRADRKSIFNISEDHDELLCFLKEKLVERKKELLDPVPEMSGFQIKKIVFPWKRLFEIDFDVQLSV